MEFAIVYFEVVNVTKELHNIDKAFEMSFRTMDPEIYVLKIVATVVAAYQEYVYVRLV